jgi:hypothetical protein
LASPSWQEPKPISTPNFPVEIAIPLLVILYRTNNRAKNEHLIKNT